MYFFTRDGKQHVDGRGDLLLTHNTEPLMARNKSAAPRHAQGLFYVKNIAAMNVWGKFRATRAALKFIWGPDTSLTQSVIDRELKP